jgi:hypothetical protein
MHWRSSKGVETCKQVDQWGTGYLVYRGVGVLLKEHFLDARVVGRIV